MHACMPNCMRTVFWPPTLQAVVASDVNAVAEKLIILKVQFPKVLALNFGYTVLEEAPGRVGQRYSTVLEKAPG